MCVPRASRLAAKDQKTVAKRAGPQLENTKHRAKKRKKAKAASHCSPKYGERESQRESKRRVDGRGALAAFGCLGRQQAS